jgi:hypothetical protein
VLRETAGRGVNAALACAVAIGLCPPIARLATSHLWLVAGFVATVPLVVVGILLPSCPRLKIGHHGSRNSTTSEFLAAVNAHLAIISLGEDNPYGHPNAELLERLANAGVRVLRTDRDGAVHILMDAQGVEVRCFVPCLSVSVDGLRAQAPNHDKGQQQQ